MTKPPTAARPGNPSGPAPTSGPGPASQSRSGKGRPGKRKGDRGRTGATTGTDGAARNDGGVPPSDAAALLRRLTAREAEAFAHLAAGRDLAETAAALGVSPTTARSYQHRALRKLGSRTQAEISALAALLPPAPARGPGAAKAAAATPAPAAAAAPEAETEAGPGTVGTRAQQDGGPSDRATQKAGTTSPDGPARTTALGGRSDRRQPPRADRPSSATSATADTTAVTTTDAASPARPTATTPDPRTGAKRPPGPGPGEATASPVSRSARTGRPGGGAAGGKPRADGTGSTAPEQPRRNGPAEAPRGRSRPGGAPATDSPGAAARAATARAADHRATADRADGADRTGRPRAIGAEPPAGTVGWAVDAGGGAHREAVFEEVYEAGHTRLVQQVFLLTACKHRAVHCVGRAFGEARRRWEEVVAAAEPEQWVRTRAFELALSPWHRGGPRRAHVWRLPHRRIKVRPADEGQAVLPDHDRLTDRDRALLKALRRLSRPQRRALVLHDGLGLPAAAVAVEVESTVAAAEGRVWAARTALAQWVPDLVGPDPAADGFADRLCALLHRAGVRGAPEPHRPPVPLLRARHGLVNAGRTGAAALLTVTVGGAVAATLAGGGPGELFRPPDPPPPSLCAAVPTLATEPEALLPLLPDGAPSGIHSLWCSPTPGLEPVVVDPPPPRDGPYRPPTAGRAGGAQPPPGAAAAGPGGCAPWVLHPCPAGPRVQHPAQQPAQHPEPTQEQSREAQPEQPQEQPPEADPEQPQEQL